MRLLPGLLLAAVAAPCGASSCACEALGDDIDTIVADRFDQAEVVAVAEVTGDTAAPVAVGSRTSGGRWLVLEVRRTLKGRATVGARFYAATPGIRNACAPSFEAGNLVLAFVEAGALVDLSACSVSGPLESRAAELEVLSRIAPDPR